MESRWGVGGYGGMKRGGELEAKDAFCVMKINEQTSAKNLRK